MGLMLFSLMIAIPVLEIGVFIVVGRYIGLWPTLAGIFLTALIGSAIIRHQGLAMIKKARQTIDAGEAPVREVVEGAALLIAGIMLLTPGFVTDTVGFLLLVPSLRQTIAATMIAQAMRRAEVRVHAGAGRTAEPPPGGRPAGGRRPGSAGVVIDGEWTDLSEDKPDDPARATDFGSSDATPTPSRGWVKPSGSGDGRTNDSDETDQPPPITRAQS